MIKDLIKIIFLLLHILIAKSSLSYDKVHLVDRYFKGNISNYLFRGNMPANNTTFAYDELISAMQKRAEEQGIILEKDIYLIVISLNNILDGKNFWHEIQFWHDEKHKNIGKFINWPLGFSGLIPANAIPEIFRNYISKSNFLWIIDKLPSRIKTLREMLLSNYNKPTAIFVHCTYGCDRTGELIGGYRMQYLQNITAKKMYELDVKECTRPPNYYSTHALEWYCIYLETVYSIKLGDCTDFAICEPFGKCEPK